MSGFAFEQTWVQLEPDKGQLNVSALASIMQTLGNAGLYSIVNLAAINTNAVSVPADLADSNNPDRLRPGLLWNSSEIILRYAQMLGQAVPMIVAHGGAHVGVGNEVDATLQSLPSEHAVDYAVFAYVARAIARNLTGGEHMSALSVGVTLTYAGLSSPDVRSSEWFAYVSSPQLADAIPITYYPLQGNFSVEDPATVVFRDLALLPSLLPGAPSHAAGSNANEPCVVLQEVGFPSGYPDGHVPPSTDGSSQKLQAEFYRLAFDAIAGPALNSTGRSRFAGFDWLVDLSPDACAYLERYYRITSPAFVEYLCSLGVVGIDGSPKLALEQLLEGIHTTESGAGKGLGH